MKLHDVANRTWVRLMPSEDFRVPPSHREMNFNEIIFFDHIDGMYSYCKDKDGVLVHPVAWSEVEPVMDHKILRELITWGTRGIDQTDLIPTYLKIKDISDSHLNNLVTYFKKFNARPDIDKAIHDEAQYRSDNNIKVKDYED